MTFESWLAANGYDADKLTASQKKHLQAAYQAEVSPPPVASPVATVPQPQPAPTKQQTPYEAKLEAAEKEAERRSKIDEIASEQIQANIRYPERIKHFDLMRNAAIEGGWDVNKFQIEMLTAKHKVGPIFTVSRDGGDVTEAVITAALCRHSGLADMDAKFKPETLEIADKKFGRGGLTLGGLVDMTARRNGWSGHSVKTDMRRALKAAFREDDSQGFQSSVGPSVYSISNILSDTANLHIRTAFEAVESEWRKIALISNVTDYREITTVALTGDLTYKKVAPGGEVKHGTFGDTSYTNKADIYALLIGIDEQDLVNDSLGALTSLARRIGRGGAITMNKVFWAEWLDDSAFFPTDKSLDNYDDGNTDSVLTAAGLTNMTAIFRAQTDPDGNPLAIRPRILLVPPALESTALTLMNSEALNLVTATTATSGMSNIWRNRFEVVSSDYLTNPLAWYLVANPQDLPAIEMVFLNGQQMPETETAEMAIDRLGIVIRGKHSFGARKQDYRAAVKAKGEN